MIGKCIRKDIIEEVKRSKYYTVIADEVTDASNKEQLSIVLRYVQVDVIKEVFVGFIYVERITGESLANAILKWLETAGLSPSDMRGQCYDGANNMSGARSGCRSIVQQQAPMAMYFHCAAHRLNLAVVSACKIQAFKNVESYIGEIARFFAFSSKRQRLFDRVMDMIRPPSKAKKLKDACRTCWIQRIDSYAVFLELLPTLHTTFQAMVIPRQYEDFGTDWNWDGETITKANGFLFQLQSSSFLTCFKILIEIFHKLRSLTMKLQMQAIDVVYAYKEVQSVISTLKGMRERSSSEFKNIFSEAQKLGKDLHGQDFELSRPRIVRHQMHRATSSPEEHYHVTLYDEFLSHVIRELLERFTENSSQGSGLLYLLPSESISVEVEDEIPRELAQAVDFYQDDLPHSVMFPTEYRMWVRKWKQHNLSTDTPKKLVDVLQMFSATEFPNIFSLLKLALTLPITSCESERSFSLSR